jgi:predicted ATPase
MFDDELLPELIFEDAHWIDPTSMEALERPVSRASARRSHHQSQIQFRSTLQFSAYRLIVAKRQRRSMLHREVARALSLSTLNREALCFSIWPYFPAKTGV